MYTVTIRLTENTLFVYHTFIQFETKYIIHVFIADTSKIYLDILNL